MKISKPILIALIGSIIFSSYLLFFTGKKKPPTPVAPLPATGPTTAVHPPVGLPGLPAASPTTPGEPLKPKIDALKVAWDRDPFILPRSLAEGSIGKPSSEFRLVAIIEGRKGRLAIVGNEIVAKGDYIGDERVQDIGKDRIVLTKNGKRRMISAMDDASIKQSSKEDNR